MHEATSHRQRINGVFSQTRTSVIGTGTTAKKTEVVSYFQAREREDGVLEVQALGEQAAFGPVAELTLDDFLENYLPEPQKSLERAQAEAKRRAAVDAAVAQGDVLRAQGRNYSAEFEYGRALALEEDNVRANFGIGQCYIARGDSERARAVFERLVGIDAAFSAEHKHLFNEFGISLRKSGLAAEALAYYARAAELCPDDENLRFNMARAALDLGDAKAATEHLAHCLARNARHDEARRLLEHVKRLRQAKG